MLNISKTQKGNPFTYQEHPERDDKKYNTPILIPKIRPQEDVLINAWYEKNKLILDQILNRILELPSSFSMPNHSLRTIPEGIYKDSLRFLYRSRFNQDEHSI
jgi:hypothetical protein